MTSTKTNPGNYFEDFKFGQVIVHPTPRTVTVGDVALYTSLYGTRFAVQSSDAFAKAIGYPQSPLDDLLTFHMVFGKTTPEISLNAIANLGYANCRFLKPVYPGDTLASTSEVIGLKENSNRETGTVYVKSTGRNQNGDVVLEYVRWVMVRKRDKENPAPEAIVPKLPERVDPKDIGVAVPALNIGAYDFALAGSPYRWGDYEVGEKIDHVDGMTLEEAEHQIATRPRAIVQRAEQRLPSRRHQRRPARVALFCRRYGLCVVGGAGEGRAAGPQGRRRAADPAGGGEEQRLRDLSPEEGGRPVRRRRPARSRHLGAVAALIVGSPRSVIPAQAGDQSCCSKHDGCRSLGDVS